MYIPLVFQGLGSVICLIALLTYFLHISVIARRGRCLVATLKSNRYVQRPLAGRQPCLTQALMHNKLTGKNGLTISQAGFSLVELLVAIIIGLLVVLVATTGMNFYEANRRTSMGTNSAEENGLASAYAIQGDARQAGFGSNMSLGTIGCPNIRDPIVIGKGSATTDSDTLSFTYFNALDPVVPDCGTMTTYVYRVNENKLQRSSDGGKSYEDLAENIVQMKAQYGINLSSSSTKAIEQWTNTLPNTTLPLAIRYVIVARSPQLEKLSNGGVCSASAASGQPTQSVPLSKLNMSPNDDPIVLDLSAIQDWQCYSYRVISLTVPLKNILIQQNKL